MLHHVKPRPHPNRRDLRARRTLDALRLALEMHPNLFAVNGWRDR